MIIAVGYDLIELHRIKETLDRQGDRFLQRIYHKEELEYCMSHANPIPSLAARFAAKEAFQKVWFAPHSWHDVWVHREPGFARPVLRFSSHITQEMQRAHWVAHVSLTHTKENAGAVVILEQHKFS